MGLTRTTSPPFYPQILRKTQIWDLWHNVGVTTADRSADENRVENLDAEVERLQGKLTRRERDAKRLQRENDRLKQQVERLKRQLDEARRAGRRQAAPFAKDRPQGRGGVPDGGPVRSMAATAAARARRGSTRPTRRRFRWRVRTAAARSK